jgi:hypothetical protein
MLRLTVPYMPGETPAGFCSRLALRNACDNVRQFCRLLGLRFQSIVDGSADAIQTLADISGADVELLTVSAARKLGDGRFSLNGQIIMKPMLRRSSVRVCPYCLQEDLNTRPDLGRTASWQRQEWLLSAFRRCAIHGTSFITSTKQLLPQHVHDFHLAVLSRLESLPDWKAAATPLPTSRFENDLRNRLFGISRDAAGWLGHLPFYATAKLCEAVGLLALHGPKVRRDSQSEADMHIACDEGHAILDAGRPSIDTFFDDMIKAAWARSEDIGLKALFGELYNWLAYGELDPVYDSFREIMRERLLRTLPFEPGDEVMGRPVASRRLWSVHAAAKATGAHQKRLRKLLAAGGLIPADTADLSNDRIVFQANTAAAEFLSKVADAMPQRIVGQYIGAPRGQMMMLMEEGFLTPFIVGGRSGSIKDHAFAKADTDEFLRKLLLDAVGGDLDGFADIPTTAKKLTMSAVFIVRLILDRKLKRVRRNPDKHGYMSVMVDPNEVKRFFPVDTAKPISGRQATKLTHWSESVIKMLVFHGHLKGVAERRCVRIDRQSLAEFTETFVHLHDLATESGIHFLTLRNKLVAAGIRPKFDPKIVKATFYSRKKVKDFLALPT